MSVSFQVISNLEAQLTSLREELQMANVQHKQQLAEMVSQREEEKQKAFLDKETKLERLRSDMERIHKDLERSHQQDRDAALEKVGSVTHQHGIWPILVKQILQQRQHAKKEWIILIEQLSV